MSPSIRLLNNEYRDYFMEYPDQVTTDLKRLEQFLVEHHCTFRGVSMPTLLKPNFISRAQSMLLKEAVEVMSRALTKVIRLYLDDDRVREIMCNSAIRILCYKKGS